MLESFKTLLRSRSGRAQDRHAAHLYARSKGLPVGMTPEDFAGLRLGGMVSLDMLALKAFDGLRFDSSWSGEPQHIAAVGVVELGQGEQLVRFYLANDTWIQASVANQQVFEYKVFDFWEAADLADVEFDRQINAPEGKSLPSTLGHVVFELPAESGEAKPTVYARVWGDPEASWSPPVMLEEQVVSSGDTNTSSFTTHHHCMLYEREDAGSDRFEYILLSAESNPVDDTYQRVTSLGVDIRALVIDAH